MDYPYVRNFIEKQNLPCNHILWDYLDGNSLLPLLDYYLSFQHVDGFNEKIRELREKPVKGAGNDGEVSWIAICAEIEAAYILGRQLSVHIKGFEKKSPKCMSDATCDFLVDIDGRNVYCEVKCLAKEERQSLPQNLEVALKGVCSHYRLFVELQDRNFKCEDPSDIVKSIQRHIEQGVPDSSIVLDGIKVTFIEKGEGISEDHGFVEIYDPTGNEDIHSWFGKESRVGRSGTPMVPMLRQAEHKGADYLMARIPLWLRPSQKREDKIDEIIVTLFQGSKKVGEYTYESKSPILGKSLAGVVLFSSSCMFRIVNNISRPDKSLALPCL